MSTTTIAPSDLEFLPPSAHAPAERGVVGALRRFLGITADALTTARVETILVDGLNRTAEAVNETAQLVAGQRRDFDQLAEVLQFRDQQAEADRATLDAATTLVQQLAQQLHHYSSLTAGLQDRLHWYETRVPGLVGAKKAYDITLAREKGRRERLIAEHPEWSEATKHSVLQTGHTPGEAASGNGHGAPAPNLIEVVQRMPETPDDLADPSRLRIVRDGDTDGDDDGLGAPLADGT